ncbi:hypothetical protein ACFYZ4_15020 [Streptomyces sp. NPDC001513]|uniref:hypothetical protein n=1 Tax=Streptomyces sp. NPDC001513 TaxID=3364580 RepID=UPI0036B11BFA
MTEKITSTRHGVTIIATPAHGCGVCGALAKQYAETRDRDLLLEINNHPHAEPKLKTKVGQLLRAGVTVT